MAHFPVIMTKKYACDKAVVSLLRSRTLGNSPTALRNTLLELHSEEWVKKQLAFLEDCQRHKRGLAALGAVPVQYKEALPFSAFPTPRLANLFLNNTYGYQNTYKLFRWFLAVYVREVWSRLPELLAASTSVFGDVLKIDSTKKVCKKLQGAAANTASWATNVGNERGEIVISVLTESESSDALLPMVEGLMARYEKAGKTPPVLLYTDRDCCCSHGPSKYQSVCS